MSARGTNEYDIAVIGGGLFGSMIALSFASRGKKVLLFEKSDKLIKRASYNNQARIHNGYHYPRSYLTALRSRVNHPIFLRDFSSCVMDKCQMYYAIASTFSKTTAGQFAKFCDQIGSEVKPAEEKIKRLFNPVLIEEVFKVEEGIFDAGLLRREIEERLSFAKIKVLYGNSVVGVEGGRGGVEVYIDGGKSVRARHVFNCTYSQINRILKASGLTPLPFKYELTEMPLFMPPGEIDNIGITVLDGPFFGVLPFPDRNLQTIYHVRYTVHATWFDDGEGETWPDLKRMVDKSNFVYMVRDASRYMPMLGDIEQVESLWEVRTVLREYETNDGRPILFRKNYGFEGFHVVMGGKIDNVYDILSEIDNSRELWVD